MKYYGRRKNQINNRSVRRAGERNRRYSPVIAQLSVLILLGSSTLTKVVNFLLIIKQQTSLTIPVSPPKRKRRWDYCEKKNKKNSTYIYIVRSQR